MPDYTNPALNTALPSQNTAANLVTNPATTTTGATGAATGDASIDPALSTISPNFAQYIYSMLGKGEQAANMPYQPFEGDRFAGPSTLQNQAFTGIGSLATPGQFGKATTGYEGILSATKGQAGLNAADPSTVASFMSPYQQGVTDIAKREAMRTGQITGNNMNAQATQAGAFGGSRQGLMQAENQRNLGMQLGDIQTKGSQDAYTQAMNALQAQRTSGLYGQLGGSAGLGSIGTQQGNIQNQQLQQMLTGGATQNALSQQPLDFGYQQWQESLNYPQTQAKNMQSLLGGLPLAAQQYNPGTSALTSALTGGLAGVQFNNLINKPT